MGDAQRWKTTTTIKMRYLTSISLALVVLMALACTVTPAEPTPAKPTSSGAFSCMELANTLAAAQTETAARVLTDSWNESGCAHKVAGVTKTPIPSPTPTPTIGPTSPPVPTRTPTPDPWNQIKEYFSNAQLAHIDDGMNRNVSYDALIDVFQSYGNSPEAKEHYSCVTNASSKISRRDDSVKVYYRPTTDTWLIEATDRFCKGIVKFEVEDNTGKVTYLGSSLDK